jgi:uncharacterized protein (TIGR00106 family)
MIVAELSVVPVGSGTSVSGFVKAVLDVLEKEGVKFELHAMGTVIEAEDLKTLLFAVEKAHEAVFAEGAKRVITTLRIDDRRDKEISIKSKINAVKQRQANEKR